MLNNMLCFFTPFASHASDITERSVIRGSEVCLMYHNSSIAVFASAASCITLNLSSAYATVKSTFASDASYYAYAVCASSLRSQ